MPDRTTLVDRAVALSWFTIAYNLAEGIASIWFGVSEDSMALAGFGADSFIEVFSAMLVLWRLRSESGQSAGLPLERERTATLGIGALFLLLAAITAGGAAIQLAGSRHPETTFPGVVIAALSLSFMIFLWRAKRRVAEKLDSATVAKDADCSLACIKLSSLLLAGSLAFMIAPALWWIDAAAALGLSLLIAHEGVGTIRGALKPDFAGGCGCD
ncbi:MAG: cation transporter [Elusimicrobiota bacterium]|nr:MAG: cation transporter [Elusimicrobiota bacterium]